MSKDASIDTHNKIVDFGKHRGERWTRIPISYLKWLINEDTQYSDIAKAELDRRGTVTEHELEISNHAIDRVSLYCRDIWKNTSEEKEGLHSWLYRLANEALSSQKRKKRNIKYKGMRFVFNYGILYPTLVTVIRLKDRDNDYGRNST